MGIRQIRIMAISIHGPQGKLIIKALRYPYKAIEDLHI